MNKKYFLDLADYNVWANNKMAEWLSQISAEQWTTELVGSFTSLESTAIHTAGAEKIWFERLNDGQQPFLTLTFEGNKTELLEIWKASSQNLKNYIEGLAEDKLLEIFAFTNLKGEKMANERYKALAHVFNHSSYHRGQLVNYLRQVGFTDVGSTDMINYFRSI